MLSSKGEIVMASKTVLGASADTSAHFVSSRQLLRNVGTASSYLEHASTSYAKFTRIQEVGRA